MSRNRRPRPARSRALTAGLLVTACAVSVAALAGCGDSGSGNPSPPAAAGTFSGTNVPSVLNSLLASGRAAASSAAASISDAAASFEASVEANVGRSSKAARDALAKVSGKGNAIKDVSISGLPKAESGGTHTVIVNITNRTSSKASFAVEVQFANSDGKIVDSTVVGAPNLKAGDTAHPLAFSLKDISKTLFPRVAKAQRYTTPTQQ
ncbi:hypothetical protein [Actinacidiphila yeochonensis]|uniref:hypothetical protein n=1 Tax=Actinacidiphila yeochonensis TaxID=89050 RepID=UPI00056771C6|nr:hypothetical protein [Actinacidiphila yeochonensis]